MARLCRPDFSVPVGRHAGWRRLHTQPTRSFSPTKFRALLEAEKRKEGGGVTCYRLAKDADMASVSTVYHHRDGRRNPTALVVKSYAASLGVPVEALYEDEKNPENISYGT